MNKKLLTVLIIIIAFGSAGFFAWKVYTPLPKTTDTSEVENTNNDTAAETDSGPETVEETTNATSTQPVGPKVSAISYTSDGFDQNNITTKAGDSVRFTNSSNNLMWVASDNHPTHTLYAEFDQKTAVPKGGVFTFKFDKVGTWTFHNHVKPSDKGTITVTE